MDPLVITPGQARYLFCGPTAAGYDVETEPLVITDYDAERSWIFVEAQRNLGEDSSGVWVNEHGAEMYGGGGEGHDPNWLDKLAVQAAVGRWVLGAEN